MFFVFVFLFVEYSKTQFPGLFFPKIKLKKIEKLPTYDQNHELCKNLSCPTFWTCCFYVSEKRLFVCQKRSFFDILERKEWPLDQKIEVKKKTTIDSFPKALVNKFCPKWNFFSSVFFKEIMLIFWISKRTIFRPEN